MISQTELEQAVTAAGGTTQGADALYAKLDPNNTGSVTEQQFAQGPGGKRWKKKFRDRDRQRPSDNPGNQASGGSNGSAVYSATGGF